MFDNLIESKAKSRDVRAALIFSAVLHAVLDHRARCTERCRRRTQLEKPKAEKVEFVEMKKKDEPPPPKEEPKPPPPDVVMKAPPPKGFQVLTAPIKIPDVLPDIDLSKKVTNEEDFSGKGVAGGIAKGVVGGTPQPVNADQPYFEFQVEKQVAPFPGNPRAALSRHAPLGERRRRSARAVRRRHDGPRRDEHLQGAQVDARSVHERREDRAAAT